VLPHVRMKKCQRALENRKSSWCDRPEKVLEEVTDTGPDNKRKSLLHKEIQKISISDVAVTVCCRCMPRNFKLYHQI